MKVARAFTGCAKIAKCEGTYHGAYDVVETSQEARSENWGDVDAPNPVPTAAGNPKGVLDDVVIIPINNVELGEKILRAKGNDLAAVLIDVMPNRAGLVPTTPEFLEMLRRVTQEIGALLIFDRVITFRLGYGINPDVTALGKIIGGCLPIGANAGRKDVMAVYDPSNGAPNVDVGWHCGDGSPETGGLCPSGSAGRPFRSENHRPIRGTRDRGAGNGIGLAAPHSPEQGRAFRLPLDSAGRR
jgi:glutamate-1-semialdehyde 2,1-aminomutase